MQDVPLQSLQRANWTLQPGRVRYTCREKAAVGDTYDAYIDLHDCVMDPGGNDNTWTEESDDADSALVDDLDELDQIY